MDIRTISINRIATKKQTRQDLNPFIHSEKIDSLIHVQGIDNT